MQIEQLKKEIPYQWKVQTAKEWGCECVAYIDARQVMDLLDEVVGAQNWADDYKEIDGKVFCSLGILINDKWVFKTDCGTESSYEKEKGQASDAFKRAAVKWGVGRFLYHLDTVKTKSVENGKDNRGNPRYLPADDKGKRIYDLTKYIRNLKPQPAPKPEPLATAEQQESLKVICQDLSWSGAQLNKYLQQKGLSWKGLTEKQADRVLGDLGLLVAPKPATEAQKADITHLANTAKMSPEVLKQTCLNRYGVELGSLEFDQAEELKGHLADFAIENLPGGYVAPVGVA